MSGPMASQLAHMPPGPRRWTEFCDVHGGRSFAEISKTSIGRLHPSWPSMTGTYTSNSRKRKTNKHRCVCEGPPIGPGLVGVGTAIPADPRGCLRRKRFVALQRPAFRQYGEPENHQRLVRNRSSRQVRVSLLLHLFDTCMFVV